MSIAIVFTIMVSEVIGGIISNSLALLGDAGHMLVDGLALVLSLFAMTLARRPATSKNTYGFYRAEIMAALANGVLLILISFYIFYEAYQRFLSPPAVKTPIMLTVAVIGLIANVVMIFLLRAGHDSLNVRAAFWHVATDTLSSVGVIAAGILILVTGLRVIDPILAALISAVIIWGAVRLVFESVEILFEAVPRHIRLDEVVKAIKEIPGVKDLHDTHIWTITSGVYALSSHLTIQDQAVSDSTEILAAVARKLERDFGIGHTTLQAECDSCPSGFVCGISQSGNNIEVH